MDRRIFLKRSVQLLAALPFANIASGLIPSAAAHGMASVNGGFSLSIITAHPDKALEMVQSLIQSHLGNQGRVMFTEFVIAGENISEIALVRNSRLVNYKVQSDPLSLELAKMAKQLDILTKVKDPVCLQFTSDEQSGQPEKAQVFRQNVLIEELQLSQTDKVVEVKGLKGPLAIRVNEGAVSVVETSCGHKTCVQMGSVKGAGQSIVCIPNQITIALAGSGKSDALAF
ncbi:MAG: NusG domain II-containing protein [Chlorobiales bacterium]|nr:NusG domain II-containing protein [Chlorobiales bacterium]